MGTGVLNNRGGTTGRLLSLFVLVCAIYFGYLLIPQYLAYRMLTYEVESEADVAHHYSDDVIVRRIIEKASTWNIPLNHEMIFVHRDREARTIEIIVKYKVKVDLIGGRSHVSNYNIFVNEHLKRL